MQQNKGKIYFLQRLCLNCNKNSAVFLFPWPYDQPTKLHATDLKKLLTLKTYKGINETSQLTCTRSCETPHDESCDNPRRWLKQHALKRERRLTIFYPSQIGSIARRLCQEVRKLSFTWEVNVFWLKGSSWTPVARLVSYSTTLCCHAVQGISIIGCWIYSSWHAVYKQY